MLYAVYDTIEGSIWCSPKGKMVWDRIGSAKNAWNVQHPRWVRDYYDETKKCWVVVTKPRFNQQERYVIARVELKVIGFEE